MPDVRWLWVSRDAPLLTFDHPQPLACLAAPPPRTGRLLAMIYSDAAALVEALRAGPVVVINPALPEQPRSLSTFKP